MGKLLLRRMAGVVLVTLLTGFVTFAILNVGPGDAAMTLVGDTASQEELDRVREELGLDRPVIIRYFDYMAGIVLHGDFGRSLMNGRPVAQLIGERFVHTLMLALVSVVIAMVVGMVVGVMAAASRWRWIDLGTMVVLSAVISVPGFWLAMLLTMFFSLHLRLLPVAGGGTPAHIILPALTIAIPTSAMIARLTRSSLLEVSHSDYVRTAFGKGASSRYTWSVHILRNALIPVLTIVGLHLGHLLGGSFIVETIYGWPGLGRLTVQAIFDRDFPVIAGAVILSALVYQLLNLIIDISIGIVDPRVSSEGV
jgi:ABC-type dipeptide/oligopeptide/nickel transport system permease component